MLEADIIIFDCDSTLTRIEGIDELAKRANVQEQLVPLTTAAMEGNMCLEDVYKHRLELIRPALTEIDWLGQQYIKDVVHDAKPVIHALQKLGKQVHIVSGGVRQAVMQLADYLGISADCVNAVEIYFDQNGNYRGFDESSPLGRSGGKKMVCAELIGSTRRGVIIGDGITDYEAIQERLVFIGFGGVVQREKLRQLADHYVTEPSLRPVLDILFTKYQLQNLNLV